MSVLHRWLDMIPRNVLHHHQPVRWVTRIARVNQQIHTLVAPTNVPTRLFAMLKALDLISELTAARILAAILPVRLTLHQLVVVHLEESSAAIQISVLLILLATTRISAAMLSQMVFSVQLTLSQSNAVRSHAFIVINVRLMLQVQLTAALRFRKALHVLRIPRL